MFLIFFFYKTSVSYVLNSSRNGPKKIADSFLNKEGFFNYLSPRGKRLIQLVCDICLFCYNSKSIGFSKSQLNVH